MPNIGPGQTIGPGTVTSTSGYPQYGVGGGTPGSSAGWKIVKANNDAEKMKYAQQGYLAWFQTMADAQNFLGSEESLAGSGNLPSSGIFAPLAEIGDFFHRLTEGETWVRVGEFALGGVLVYAALRGLTHGSPTIGSGARAKATSPIKKVAKAGVTVAAPEVRYGARLAAKRAAPKATGKVAAHRAQVAKYGAKKPYKPPTPKSPAQPRVTYRYSEIRHTKG